MESGDELLLVEVGRNADVESVRATVSVVSRGSAYLVVEGDAALPEGMAARRVRPTRSEQVVRVDSCSGPPPPDIPAMLADVVEVRLDGTTRGGELATVVVADGRYQLEDAAGRALHSDWRVVDGAADPRAQWREEREPGLRQCHRPGCRWPGDYSEQHRAGGRRALLAVFSDSPQDLRSLTQDGVGQRGRPFLLCTGGGACAH